MARRKRVQEDTVVKDEAKVEEKAVVEAAPEEVAETPVEPKPKAEETPTGETEEKEYYHGEVDESDQEVFVPYKVRVKSKKLRVRSKANATSHIEGYLSDRDTPTIIAEENGFGKLVSGLWIMLEHTARI